MARLIATITIAVVMGGTEYRGANVEDLVSWRPIATAPKDGAWFRGRRGHLERDTQWGKTSHVPLYGWCHVASMHDGNADYDLWEPLEWRPSKANNK